MLASLASIPGIVLIGCSDSEEDAFSQLCAAPCDILVLDIQLSQGTGLGLLRRLAQQSPITKRVDIVFSNHVSSAYRRAAEQSSVSFFFDKTTEFTQLCALLERFGAGESLTPNWAD